MTGPRPDCPPPANPDQAHHAAPHHAVPHHAVPHHAVPSCTADGCVTCSDEAVAVRVLRLLGDGLAVVGTAAGEEQVSVALVEAEVGDTVLVHAKEAIAVLDGPAS